VASPAQIKKSFLCVLCLVRYLQVLGHLRSPSEDLPLRSSITAAISGSSGDPVHGFVRGLSLCARNGNHNDCTLHDGLRALQRETGTESFHHSEFPVAMEQITELGRPSSL